MCHHILINFNLNEIIKHCEVIMHEIYADITPPMRKEFV